MELTSPPARVVVIGGSLGGIEALCPVLDALPLDLPAPVLVTVHLPPGTSVSLAERLNRRVAMPVVDAVDGAALIDGHVYMAVANRHLTVRDGAMRLERSGHVNRVRPSIDVLFRTASRSHGR